MKSKLFLIVFALMGLPLFAQTETPTDPETWLYSFGGLVGIIPIVVDFLKIKINLHGLGLQIFSWTVGILIAFVGFWLHLGIFIDITWLETLFFGLGASLAANGVFTIPQVKIFLTFLFARFK